MTTELQAHSKALENQTTNTARELAILTEKDQEYARQGQAKTKEVDNLDDVRDSTYYSTIMRFVPPAVVRYCFLVGEQARVDTGIFDRLGIY